MIETGLNIREHSFEDLHLGAPLLEQLVHYGLPLCQTCEDCPEVKVCGGGYVAHRYSRANGFQNPSAWCQDILRLFDHIRRQIKAKGAFVSESALHNFDGDKPNSVPALC